MILHFEICDDCGGNGNGLGLTGFIVRGESFDLCKTCQQKPFRAIRGIAERKQALVERVRVLLGSETRLAARA